MKKGFLIGLLLMMLVGCTSAGSESMKRTTADKVIRRLQVDGENSFLLVLTANNCYSCDEYAKVVEQLQAEKDFELYYIDVDAENEDKLEELKITLGDVETLPMTYYFDKGVLKAENIKKNYIELETYREWLKLLKIY